MAIERSNFVTLLAWVFIVLGGFSSLIAIAQNLMVHLVFPLEDIRAQMATGQSAQHIPAFARFMMQYFEWIFGFILLLSLATFISAVGLLKRQEWARLTFIGLMLLGVVWNVVGIFIQQLTLTQMPIPSDAPLEVRQNFAGVQQIMGIVMAVFGLAFAGLFGWLAWRLRAPHIVAEFRNAI